MVMVFGNILDFICMSLRSTETVLDERKWLFVIFVTIFFQLWFRGLDVGSDGIIFWSLLTFLRSPVTVDSNILSYIYK